MFCDPTVSRPIPATGNLKSGFGDVAGQHFIVFRARGNGFLTGRMFSTGRRNNAPTGYKMANHEETSRLAYLFFSFADVWVAKGQSFRVVC